MATLTNTGIEIPDVGADNSTWGTILNAALSSLDGYLKSDGTGTSTGLNVGSGKTLVLTGTQTVTGSINAASGSIIAPTATAPSQTTEGSIVWDSNDDLLTVGDGSSRKTMVDTSQSQTVSNKTLAAVTHSTSVFQTGVISPSALSAGDSADYAPTGLSTCNVMRLSASGAASITGLTGGASGRRISVFNVGTTYSISLVDESGGSTAANRFKTNNGADVVIYPGGGVDIWYDGTSSRWRVISV